MKIRFFKYNIYRQIILYCSIILSLLLLYDGVIINQSFLETIIAGAVGIVLIAWLIYQYISCVIIDDKGVTYHSLLKHYTLCWNEVGQAKVMMRWRTTSQKVWIIILKSDDPKDLYKKKNAMNREGECITFCFNMKAVKEILKHRKEDILDQSLYNTPIYNELRRWW